MFPLAFTGIESAMLQLFDCPRLFKTKFVVQSPLTVKNFFPDQFQTCGNHKASAVFLSFQYFARFIGTGIINHCICR